MSSRGARAFAGDGAEMVLRSGDLNSRLERVLRTATHVDIATAWATGGKHLRLLTEASRRRHQQLSVRAIVGISGRATRYIPSPTAVVE